MTFARDLANFADISANNLTFRNLIINGAMQIAQRATSVASISTTSINTADRWFAEFTSLGTWTQSVENDAPTGSGFRKSLKMLVTTADASPAAGDYALIQQRIEGQNLQQLLKGTSSAKQITLSFWVKSNVTGTYNATLYDQDNSGRFQSRTYTISASATWEKKTVTFDGDTTGVLDNDNARSLDLSFWIGAGTNLTSGTANAAWGTTTANLAPGNVNVGSTNNNYWQITGVQLEVGSSASAYEFKPIDVELAQCQRYYYLHASGSPEFIGFGTYFTATDVFGAVYFPVTMRVAPTAVSASGSNIFRFWTTGLNDDFDSIGIQSSSKSAVMISQASGTISGTAFRSGVIQTASASASIAFSAEL